MWMTAEVSVVIQILLPVHTCEWICKCCRCSASLWILTGFLICSHCCLFLSCVCFLCVYWQWRCLQTSVNIRAMPTAQGLDPCGPPRIHHVCLSIHLSMLLSALASFFHLQPPSCLWLFALFVVWLKHFTGHQTATHQFTVGAFIRICKRSYKIGKMKLRLTLYDWSIIQIFYFQCTQQVFSFFCYLNQ